MVVTGRTGGFTLLELLVIVAIIGTMVGVAALNVGSGRQSAHMRNAVRSAISLSRHARSMALLKQKPVILTYSEEKGEDETPGGRIELEYGVSEAATGGSTAAGGQMRTVTGRLCEPDLDDGEAPADWGAAAGAGEGMGEEAREFPGVRLKVELLDDGAGSRSRDARQTGISVFSNVDYLRGKTGKRASGGEADRRRRLGRTGEDAAKEDAPDRKLTDPVRITFEPNGRCEPHRITLYRDGADEDSGTSFTVDRFGTVKVDDEDDDR